MIEIPGYHVERPLGRGAAAQVFLAREAAGLGRPVALKVFAPGERAAFERELAVLREIEELRRRERDVHIVQSLGSGEFPGGAFIAFELMERGSLSDIVAAEGPLPCERALALIRDAARAVGRLHRAGLYHRDLKPGNLLVGADGHVRLGDFGIARPLAGTVTAAGSPAFAAPEVIAGRRDADGRRVDIYGLGATLSFLLVGEAMLPGRADVFALERAGVPRGVQAAILRATDTQADARPAEVEEFLKDLEIDEKSRGPSDGRASLVETDSTPKPREESMQTIDDLAPPRRAPFMPFWAYTLIISILASFIATVNVILLHRLLSGFEQIGLQLPVPTKFYLAYPWGIFTAAVLSLALFPLLDRMRRLFAVGAVVLGSISLVAILAISLFLPYMRILEQIGSSAAASPAGTGWSGEPLPAGMRRGAASPVYVWKNPADAQALEIEMVYVPPGPFIKGRDLHGPEQAMPVGYYIARNDTTYEQYTAFCRASGHAKPENPSVPWTDVDPVVNVDWNDATAFCTWAGLRLPTEDEWEKAARGTDGRMYPWGNEGPSDSTCNWEENSTYGNKSPSPVGSFPAGASPFGALDMAGNVWQWTSTLEKGGQARVIRGGGFKNSDVDCRLLTRFWEGPSARSKDMGFRPAVALEPRAASVPAAVPAGPQEAAAPAPRPEPAGADWRAPEPLPAGMRRGSSRGVYVWKRPGDAQALEIEMVYVPAGPFLMGDDRHEQAMPSGYFIARNDTTYTQYSAFCRASGHARPKKPSFSGGNDHPVVNVDWNDATAFCTWAGLRLPSEEEWEKAARGTDGRKFPWGDDWDGMKCNHGTGSSLIDDSDGFANTSPVGHYPAGVSPYGALDMAGNVYQWTSSLYSVAPDVRRFVPRGGCYLNDARFCRSADRNWTVASTVDESTGFRPARSAD